MTTEKRAGRARGGGAPAPSAEPPAHGVHSGRYAAFCLLVGLALFARLGSGHASQGAFTRVKPHLSIAVLGTSDQGNAALTSAITKILAQHGRATFIPIDDLKKSAGDRSRGISLRIR